MTRLDYRVFYAHGDDFGGSIVSRIARRHPESIVGLHVSEWLEPPAAAQHDLTSPERKYLLRLRERREAERAYGTIAATRPRREWLERVYVDLRSYQRRERGGHFMAIENPDGFVDELRSFFEQLTTER